METRRRLTEGEKQYIRTNASEQTISELAKALARPETTVFGFCLRNSVNRKSATRGRKKGFSLWKKEATGRRIMFDKPIFPEEKQPIVRPPAVYGNSRSPYGIATELHNHSSIQAF